jgi:beta-N-acetylhexosaminidase
MTNALATCTMLAACTVLVGCTTHAADAPPPAAPQRVVLGIDRLLGPEIELIQGKRVGLITNPSGVDGRLFPSADRLVADDRFQLVQLYGPEHGIRGDVPAGDTVTDSMDDFTGVPVESLYGARKSPSPESLEKLDVLLFDIQDIGSRTYTYVSTLGEAMRAAALAKKPLIVLDRPNPIGGVHFEGAVIEEASRSFIGWGPTPVTHGMTCGEIARFYNQELAIGCDLTVVRMQNWKREMAWEDTGLDWTPTSPHIPHALQAHLYVAAGMTAAATLNVSDGVGSTMPFEILGAEFVDAYEFASELEKLHLPGVRFQPLAYKPFYGKFKDKPMHGVRMVLDDARAFLPLHTSLAALVTLRRMYPSLLQLSDDKTIAKHWGNARIRAMLEAGKGAEEIEASWKDELAKFAAARERCLLY